MYTARTEAAFVLFNIENTKCKANTGKWLMTPTNCNYLYDLSPSWKSSILGEKMISLKAVVSSSLSFYLIIDILFISDSLVGPSKIIVLAS